MTELSEQDKVEFKQAIEKVQKVGTAVISQYQYAEKAISFIEYVHYNVDQVVNQAFEQTPKAQCTVGCSHCCKSRRVEVSLPEAFFIAEHIKQLPDVEQSEIQMRLDEAVDTINNHKPLNECAFLKDDACSIYEVRPAVCRKAHSQDVSACEQNKEIPQHLNVVLGAEAMMLGTQQAYQQLGYDADKKELNSVMRAALTDVSMFVEWYKAFLEKRK